MAGREIRAAARRAAMEARARRRREQAARNKRTEGLALDVLVAVGERDAAVREAELRAGVAVRAMLTEGLTATEVAQWCGEQVAAREVRRLATVQTEGEQNGAVGGAAPVERPTTSRPGRPGAAGGLRVAPLDRAGVSSLMVALADPAVLGRNAAKVVRVPAVGDRGGWFAVSGPGHGRLWLGECGW